MAKIIVWPWFGREYGVPEVPPADEPTARRVLSSHYRKVLAVDPYAFTLVGSNSKMQPRVLVEIILGSDGNETVIRFSLEEILRDWLADDDFDEPSSYEFLAKKLRALAARVEKAGKRAATRDKRRKDGPEQEG